MSFAAKFSPRNTKLLIIFTKSTVIFNWKTCEGVNLSVPVDTDGHIFLRVPGISVKGGSQLRIRIIFSYRFYQT